MFMTWVNRYKNGLIVALSLSVFFKYLLTPTATLFYELHHATGIDTIYWGYSLFKAAGYYFGIWSYQSVACVAVGLATFLIYWLCKNRQHGGDPK